jgi:hypothetical protein
MYKIQFNESTPDFISLQKNVTLQTMSAIIQAIGI